MRSQRNEPRPVTVQSYCIFPLIPYYPCAGSKPPPPAPTLAVHQLAWSCRRVQRGCTPTDLVTLPHPVTDNELLKGDCASSPGSIPSAQQLRCCALMSPDYLQYTMLIGQTFTSSLSLLPPQFEARGISHTRDLNNICFLVVHGDPSDCPTTS